MFRGTPGREKGFRERPKRDTCTVVPPEQDTLWKMVHNGIEYALMAGLRGRTECPEARQRGQAESKKSMRKPRPLRDPEHYQYDFNLADVCRSLASRQRSWPPGCWI